MFNEAPWLHYGIDGNRMTAGEFNALYKRRITMGAKTVGPCIIVTEFVGINHEINAHAPPKIFETTVSIGEYIVRSYWTPTSRQARVAHTMAVNFARCGAFTWWWLSNALVRLWTRLLLTK